MAKRKEPYIDINQTLEALREQVIESLEYCANEMPRFSNPKQLFEGLRLMTTFHNDPPGVELLQTVPTLFENNYWGSPGYGDCDCFSILVLAMCVAHGWNDNEIVLTGRNKKIPVHIYTATVYKGKRYVLDLTNPYINMEREYPYKQIIPI